MLAIRLRDPGPDGPKTLTTRHLLALARAVQDDQAGAARLYAELQPDQVRIMGRDHHYTLRIRTDYASTLISLGRHSEARAELQQVLEGQTRQLGDDHPSTRSTRAALEQMESGIAHVSAEKSRS